MAIKLTVRERCTNCGTIHTRREGDWIIEDTCPNLPPGPKYPPARWRASEVTWLPDPSRMVLVHTSEPGNHGGADCWCKPQLKPLEEAGLNPFFCATTITVSGVVGQLLPLDMSPPGGMGEAAGLFINILACKACGRTALSVSDSADRLAVRITNHKCAGGFDLRERLPVTGIRLS